MDNLEPTLNGVSVDSYSEEVARTVVAGYYEGVVTQRDLSAFYFAWLVLPWVCPQFQMGGECLRLLCSQVVHDDCLLALVAVPPFILELLISLGVIRGSFPGLPSSWGSPIPVALFLRSPGRDLLVHLLDML